MAREKGLEPLAGWLMAQHRGSPEAKAATFVSEEVPSADEALKGACDIIAEWVNEDAAARQAVRNIFAREAVITSKVVKGKEEEGRSTATTSTSPHRSPVARRTESWPSAGVSQRGSCGSPSRRKRRSVSTG